ncbi:MAG TPA: HesA/MoeB/ThiF family protein [Bacteroidales bacterium]|nr:HesA/MoeB/ThiF family protein [Bacteroidales bacterium]
METTPLSQREIRRYGKQIMLPGIGTEGQSKLKKASVLVVGAGGLGCPVLQYLTAAGTGRLGIIEFDKVDESNLQRQVLYGTNDVGKLKSVIVRERLEYLNSLVSLEILNLRLDSSNALRITRDYDLVVDATDNIETRYVINDSCVILGKPMVYGAIYKYEGQVAVFNYENGPTYRCFNPFSPGKKYTNPLPSEVGLMGVLPGITGTCMANEVIKIITGAGTVLSGKVLFFNTVTNSFRLISVKNIPSNHNLSSIGQIV